MSQYDQQAGNVYDNAPQQNEGFFNTGYVKTIPGIIRVSEMVWRLTLEH